MQPNWFVGLPAPVALELPPAPPATRLFAPSDRHFTIAFLGSVTEAQARSAWAALDWPLPAVEVTLGAVVPMGPPRRYSALSFTLDRGRAEVEAAIAKARVACCEAAGVAVDPRPALAHLTIARPQRRATDAERATALAWAKEIRPPAAAFTLGSVALYTWAEDRKSTLFRIVERVSCRG